MKKFIITAGSFLALSITPLSAYADLDCGVEGKPDCQMETVTVVAPQTCLCDNPDSIEEIRNGGGDPSKAEPNYDRTACLLEAKSKPVGSYRNRTCKDQIAEMDAAGGDQSRSLSQPSPEAEGSSASESAETGSVAFKKAATPGTELTTLPTYGSCVGSFTETVVPSCPAGSTECADTKGVHHWKTPGMVVNFESPVSCGKFFGPENSEGSDPLRVLKTVKFDSDEVKNKIFQLAAAVCKVPEPVATPANTQDPQGVKAAQRKYDNCLKSQASQYLRAALGGTQKCAAIQAAANATTEFEGKKKIGGDPFKCDGNDEGLAFDYPSCSNFYAWYTGLLATETGLKTYNEGAKTVTGMKAQNQASQAIANGEGQEASIDATKKTTMASASAEERLKIFYAGKAAAITAQLGSFVTVGNIHSKCSGSCCKLFDHGGADGISNADQYFPNSGVKQQIIAQIIKAGGDAVTAGLREAEYKRQANALQAVKDQLTSTTDTTGTELLKYCSANPTDSRCQTTGVRESLSGISLSSGAFGGQDYGLNNAGALNEEDLSADSGSAAATNNKTSVGDIGSMNKDAAAAKDIFNAPPAVKGGNGAPGGSSGAGSASVSASANGLSRDPGAEADKKETPIKVTSAGAAYDNGVGYAGGGWKAGSAKKDDSASANPFAAMFGKDKGRDPASVTEIDSPASDLFTKISNRYGEVQKRKALMDVR